MCMCEQQDGQLNLSQINQHPLSSTSSSTPSKLTTPETCCQTRTPVHPTLPSSLNCLWHLKLRGKCKTKCQLGATDCCGKQILELQPDFKEQKSLVWEVIENAGHICIFLPKFHCELNFIEFYWGKVKRYLRDHCDYSFQTLKENLPHALASVELKTI